MSAFARCLQIEIRYRCRTVSASVMTRQSPDGPSDGTIWDGCQPFISFSFLFQFPLLRLVSRLLGTLAQHASAALISGMSFEASDHWRCCLSISKLAPVCSCYGASDQMFSIAILHLPALGMCPQVVFDCAFFLTKSDVDPISKNGTIRPPRSAVYRGMYGRV